MNTKTKSHRRVEHSRRTMISCAALAAAAAMGSQLSIVSTASAEEEKPMFMFVQLADDLKADAAAKTLRLVNVNPQTVYFSDRPVRLAGHLKMADYLKEWTKAEGADNFSDDPPNATLSVYEPGQVDNTLAVVELSHPVVDGADLIYTYKLLDGTVPTSGGATTL